MSTPISTFREAVRVLTGDSDPDIQMIENSQLDAALRFVLDVGRVAGVVDGGYACDGARTGVTPDLNAANDPMAFAQLVYYAAKQFVTDITPVSWRTRAFSESRGDAYQKVFHLVEEIYYLENGQMGATTDYE